MKRMVALALAACMAVSSATVSFAASSYDYIEFGGWVTLDYDVLDGGNVLVPGNEYRIPILDGSDYFNEDSADVWKISASEYVPAENAEDVKAGNKKFSEVDGVKGSDGIYYLTLDVKRNLDTYYDDQTAYILIKVEEKGIDREDAEINRSMADEYEYETAEMIEAAGPYRILQSACAIFSGTVRKIPPILTEVLLKGSPRTKSTMNATMG